MTKRKSLESIRKDAADNYFKILFDDVIKLSRYLL